MELSDLRSQIEKVDDQLLSLLEIRISISQSIGLYKREHQLPICDPVREKELLKSYRSRVKPENADDIEELYRLIFDISKRHQHE